MQQQQFGNMTRLIVSVSVFVLLTCVVTGNPYGGSMGALSGASSSSNSGSGISGSQAGINTIKYATGDNNAAYARSNTGSGTINVAAPVYSADNGDNNDDSSSTSSQRGSSSGMGVISNAGASSGNQGGNFVRVAASGFGNGQGSGFAANSNGGLGVTANGGNRVQVVQMDANAAQDIGAQIQATIRQILNRFGITMNQNVQNMGGSLSYQPGRTYVFQTNGNGGQIQDSSQDLESGMSQSQSQYQSVGGGQPTVQQVVVPAGDSNYGQTQRVTLTPAQPLVVSYKLIGSPGQTNQGLSMSFNQGADVGTVSGAGSQSSSGSGTGALYNNRKATADAQQQQQQQQQSGGYSADIQQEDSASGSDYSAPQPVVLAKPVKVSGYQTQTVTNAPVRANQVGYGAPAKQSNSYSNTAYEQDNS